MRTRKLSKNIRRYAPGGFASANQTGLPEITPVYETPLIEKDKSARFANVTKSIGKGAKTGAGIGSTIGGAVGSVVPGAGTALGAGIGTVAGIGYGALIGGVSGLVKNRKEEKQRQKTNEELQRLNVGQRQHNIDLWGQRAGMEADLNLSEARQAGYNTMGNVGQEFYGAKGGVSKKPKSNPFSYSFAGGGSVGYSQSEESIKAARQKPGGSNVGKYNPNQTFAGPSGGAPRGSYPIGDIGHAKSALKLAHNAPNPSGIKAAVYNKYPSLKHEAGGFSYKFAHGGELNSYEQGMQNLNEVKGQGFDTPFYDPNAKYYDSTAHLTNKGYKMPFQNGGDTPKKTPPPTRTTTPPVDKPAFVSPEGIPFTASEVQYLRQFEGYPELKRQAINEMRGYAPPTNPRGQAATKAEQDRLASIQRMKTSFSGERSLTAPNAFTALSALRMQQEIAPQEDPNKKYAEYQERQNLRSGKILTQEELDKQAARMLTGATQEQLQEAVPEVNPQQNQGYEYENIPTKRFGGPVYKKGGRLDGINSNTFKAVGRTHEQGGIDLSRNAEVENKEVVTDEGNQYFITSAKLRNPATGNTFAQDDERISKKIGKFEGRDDNRENRNALRLLNMKKDQLHNMQQSMNGNYGEGQEQQQPQFNLGGVDPSWKKRQSGNRPYYFIPPPLMGMRFGGRTSYQYGGSDELGGQPMGGGTAINLGQNLGGDYAYRQYTPGPTSTGATGGGAMSGLGGSLGNINWGNVAGEALGAIGNYATAAGEYANQRKAIKRLEALKIPDPMLSQYVNLGRMNLGVDKAEVDKQIAASNLALDRGLTDTNVAAAARAQNMAQSLASKAAINQQERNLNQEIANRQQQVNLGIKGQNMAAMQGRQQAEFEKQAQLIGMKSEAFSKLMENLRTGQNTAAAKKFAQNQYALDAYRLPSEQREALGEYMKSRGGKLYGKSFNRFGGRITHMYC